MARFMSFLVWLITSMIKRRRLTIHVTFGRPTLYSQKGSLVDTVIFPFSKGVLYNLWTYVDDGCSDLPSWIPDYHYPNISHRHRNRYQHLQHGLQRYHNATGLLKVQLLDSDTLQIILNGVCVKLLPKFPIRSSTS